MLPKCRINEHPPKTIFKQFASFHNITKSWTFACFIRPNFAIAAGCVGPRCRKIHSRFISQKEQFALTPWKPLFLLVQLLHFSSGSVGYTHVRWRCRLRRLRCMQPARLKSQAWSILPLHLRRVLYGGARERARKRLYRALLVPTNPMHFDPGAYKGSKNREWSKVKADCEYELRNGLLLCGFLHDALLICLIRIMR